MLLVALALVRFLPVGRGPAYAVLGFGLWLSVAAAGVHPTLAGVAVALLIPVFPPRRMDVERAAELTRAFRESPNTAYARAAARSLRDSLSINERLQAAWSPYIAFIVLPIFALANAGVRLDPATLADAAVSPLTWGVIAGLVVGKFVGITGATALVRMLRIGRLAPGLTMPRIAGGAALSGIGFTIALFIVGLAIEDPETQDLARVGVLAASVIAFVLGWAIFAIGDRLRPPMAVGARLARPVDLERDHFRGRPDAPYTIVEYGDFECPFCSRATGSIDAVRDHFGDDVRWVFRHLPLEQVHPHAKESAQAVEAAALQGHFFEMALTLFQTRTAWRPRTSSTTRASSASTSIASPRTCAHPPSSDVSRTTCSTPRSWTCTRRPRSSSASAVTRGRTTRRRSSAPSRPAGSSTSRRRATPRRAGHAGADAPVAARCAAPSSDLLRLRRHRPRRRAAASTAPTMPARIVPAVSAMRMTSGCSFSDCAITTGCSRSPSSWFTR